VTAFEDFSEDELNQLSHTLGKREIPLLNNIGELVDIFILGIHDERVPQSSENLIYSKSNLKNVKTLPNYLFILAGGLGARLRPAVNDRPKPMALIGGKPIIETIINQASLEGINNFYVSTNYLAEQIESHLNKEQFSFLNIEIVRENKRLGTAGSIGMINHKIDKPILVCNADILTNVRYSKILESHNKNNADITCVIRPFQFAVPYGVVRIENNCINSIIEKPKYDFLVNAGIYVLSAEVCKLIKKDEYLDMPDFIRYCLQIGKKINPFLLHEYWIDIGYPEDYQKANNEFHLYFEG
jgi:NDP-sugar pyrophosphorylase family protein